MPITDPEKKRIAQQARLVMRICFKCGCRNDVGCIKMQKMQKPILEIKE